MTGGNWKPAAAIPELRFRARLLARIRQFFAEREVLEVTTPVLSDAGVTEVHIDSIPVPGHGYLRTSPEYFHKRLLAAGAGDLYEIGPVFRGAEAGPVNRTEFALLEWYRVGWRWSDLAAEVLELIGFLDPGRSWRHETVTWQDMARRVLGFNPLDAPTDRLEPVLAAAPDDLDWPEQLDWLFATLMQPELDSGTLTVVCDYPAEQAALARTRPGAVPVAERFELFAGRLELANGYQELTDPDQQASRFHADNRRRKRLGLRQMPIDQHLLAALQAGLPECAGVALGLERLMMVLADKPDLDGTRTF